MDATVQLQGPCLLHTVDRLCNEKAVCVEEHFHMRKCHLQQDHYMGWITILCCGTIRQGYVLHVPCDVAWFSAVLDVSQVKDKHTAQITENCVYPPLSSVCPPANRVYLPYSRSCTSNINYTIGLPQIEMGHLREYESTLKWIGLCSYFVACWFKASTTPGVRHRMTALWYCLSCLLCDINT